MIVLFIELYNFLVVIIGWFKSFRKLQMEEIAKEDFWEKIIFVSIVWLS